MDGAAPSSQDLWRIRSPCGDCEGFDVHIMDDMIKVGRATLRSPAHLLLWHRPLTGSWLGQHRPFCWGQ